MHVHQVPKILILESQMIVASDVSLQLSKLGYDKYQKEWNRHWYKDYPNHFEGIPDSGSFHKCPFGKGGI